MERKYPTSRRGITVLILPDVYTGHPNRIQRYFQYDQMDSDSEINAALDILAEFSTQQNTENETPFDLSVQGRDNRT